MTVCEACRSIEQGTEEIENDDGTTTIVCRWCGSDEITSHDEDYGSDR